MDFVSGLPKSPLGHTSIFAITDRRSKFVIALPTNANCTAFKAASMLHKHVTSIHGIPDTIVTDRDPKFLSNVW